jgi:hypothetical protein
MTDYFPVLCIKTTLNASDNQVVEGRVYWALQLLSSDMSQTYCIYANERNSYIGNFRHEYFITQAEWREKQIKTVLDD